MPVVDSGGVPIAYDVDGPADGEVVLLQHGFPDSGRLWRNQVPALTAAGYRVLVPDGRGYGRSGRPDAVDGYAVPHLLGDAVAVLDDAGAGSAHVVGHDFGAAVAWGLGAFAADRVSSVTVLSVGHPRAFRAAGVEQLEKSWYMLLFQFEGIAERWLSDDGWANLRAWAGHPDHDAVVAQLEADGSLTPALGWYRANLGPTRFVEPPIDFPPVQAPVLGLWSTGDMALTEAQMQASAAHCAGGFRYERVEGAGHWLQLDAPETVNALLLDFLRGAGR